MSQQLRILLNLSSPGRDRILTPQLQEELQQLGTVVEYDHRKEGSSHERMLELASASDVMITSWGSDFLQPEDLGKTGDLKLLIHGAGSVKRVITPEIIDSGVRTVQCALAIAKAVAHYTVGLIIVGLRNAGGRYTLLKTGTRAPWPYQDLDQTVVGLVGLSQVGRQIPPLLAPFGCRVLAYDPFWSEADAAKLGVTLVSLEELVSTADVVSLHAPMLPETHHMINADLIGKMREGTLLVNTARGGLIDQEALFARCYKGELTAYLDVTTPEPLPTDHPAWECPFIFITPHVAGPTQQTFRRIGEMITDNIRRFQNGEPLVGEVTSERYATLA